MKLSVLSLILAASSVAAFAPSVSERATTSLNAMDRRAAFGQIAAAAAIVAVPTVASADGAVSKSTTTKAKVVYGGRIAALAKAVSSGDFGAVAEEKNAFILFNSGAYPTVKDKSKKAAAIEGTNSIFAAIRKQDKSGLKSAYDAYVKANEISALPSADGTGQTYASDFGYINRGSAASIYVR